MKLTPEQKAFYEYGKARTDLNCKIKEIRNNARIRFRMEYCELPLSSRAEILNLFGFEGFIDKVRQKRAACRAWIYPKRRRCSNCKHDLSQFKGCALCHNWLLPLYWEPRKEGES